MKVVINFDTDFVTIDNVEFKCTKPTQVLPIIEHMMHYAAQKGSSLVTIGDRERTTIAEW